MQQLSVDQVVQATDVQCTLSHVSVLAVHGLHCKKLWQRVVDSLCKVFSMYVQSVPSQKELVELELLKLKSRWKIL